MAIKSLIKNCPNCGKVYEQRAITMDKRHPKEEDRWLYGSPLKICPHCKKLFIDKDLQELAVTPLRKRDKAVVTEASLKLMMMGLILGVLLYFAGLTVFAAIAAGVGLLCGAVDLALYPSRMKKLQKERAASEKRLSDPDYARMLKKAGYDIPEKYLAEAKEETL